MLVCLGIQVNWYCSAMHYIPILIQLISVEHICRNVNWLVIEIYACQVPQCFSSLYIHSFRGIYYGSHVSKTSPWTVGVPTNIYDHQHFSVMSCHGSMSFWAATVSRTYSRQCKNRSLSLPGCGWICGRYLCNVSTFSVYTSSYHLLIGLVGLHLTITYITLIILLYFLLRSIPFHPII